MKKFFTALLTCTALVFLCAFFALAAGNGYVNGSTVTYTLTDFPNDDSTAFSVYLLTSNAKIKCYGNTAEKSPQAKNGSTINKCNITNAINKGTVSSKSALKVTTPNGGLMKAAERVTFSYMYVGGKLTATVSIEDPCGELTGLAFVGRDGKGHYYSIGGTVDISALVRQANRNSAGPGGSSGSGGGSGSSGGTGTGNSGSGGSGSGSGGPGTSGPGGNSGSGGNGSGGSNGSIGNGGSGSGTSGPGGSSGPGGNSSGGNGNGTGSGGNGSGNSGSGTGSGGNSSGGSGSGSTGSGSGSGQSGLDNGGSGGDGMINDHTQDMIDIKDTISDINQTSAPKNHNNGGSSSDKPPCVLRRILG